MRSFKQMKAVTLFLLLLPADGLVDPPIANTVARNTFIDQRLTINTEFIPLLTAVGETDALLDDSSMSMLSAEFGVLDSQDTIRIDVNSGRVSKLDLNVPLFPGDNRLLWRVSTDDDSMSSSSDYAEQDLEQLAVASLQAYLPNLSALLSIDPAELFSPQTIQTAHHSNGDSDMIQFSLGRTYRSIHVRDSRAFGTIKNGNLIYVGLNSWGDVDVDTTPALGVEEARILLGEFAQENLVQEDESEVQVDVQDSRNEEKRDAESKMEMLDLCRPELQILILDNGSSHKNRDSPRYLKRHKNKKNKAPVPTVEMGKGYDHALVWRICPRFTNQKQEIMEGLVDAHTGEVYSFKDTIDYYTGVGSVYPVSNDGQVPDGILQSGYPMPFLSISGDGSSIISDSGGNYWSVGEKTVSFTGEYVHMSDQCGEAKLTAEGDFDWGGVVNGTDCDTPGFGGDGNTQASRSGYYELNRIIEIARSHLPRNGWLKQRLTANMNIPQSCNAFWDGSTVNFYRSSEQCSNTGEIAGVFDHEWAHGMDNNDLTPTIVKPSGEGIADIYTALRLGDSCIGRGFFKNPCSQFGDPCINDCTGVRDIDFGQHLSKSPHTLTWTNTNCGSAENVHCRGLVYSEAVWSLWKRDLPAFYGYDDNTALEIVMRLTFIAAGNVATWYSGSAPFGGCGGDSGYLSYLLADDDDGDISNGTPHMQAIYAAHNRQEIACDEPTVQDSGCEDSPNDAPLLTLTPGSMENHLSWTSVINASYYQVFRTEGVHKCNQGKVLLNTMSADVLNYTDTGLMNGRNYYYIVIPKGSDDACFGPASECHEVAPLDGPAFQFTCQPELTILNKDGPVITSTHQCTLFAVSDYSGTISLSCDASKMDGVNCTVAASVTFSSGDEYQNVSVTLDASPSTPTGQETVTLFASDGAMKLTAHFSLVIVTPGGNLTASYDPVIRAPRCVVSCGECSSGDLLDGKGVDEVNSPNALLKECNDGIWGEYHVHPSNDKIVIKAGRLDGTGSEIELTERSYATISATVWSTFATSCFADFYYTNNISSPTWEYIGTQVTSNVREPETLKMDYELPVGLEQAIRVHFRYKGSPGACPSGGFRNYGDVDDLVFVVKESQFYISCPDSLVVVEKDDAPVNNTKDCILYTASSFTGTISFSCDPSVMTGVNCAAPSDVDIESGGQEMIISYVVEATESVVAGEEESILVFAEAIGISKKSSFPMLVVSAGGIQKASFDGELGAPRCFAEGSECSSGSLLDGRGEVGPEPNAPNSLDDCTDGNSGDYRVDEQSDALTVRAGRLDGTGLDEDISEGSYITIAATVFAYNTNDRADFFATSDAYNVQWQYIGSLYSEEVNATEVIEIEYKLPQGPTQAVRVKYDYQGNITTCRETSYGDVDDLVFAVKYVPFYISCPMELFIFNIEDTPIATEQSCTIYSQSDFQGSLSIVCDSSALSGVGCTSVSPIAIELGTLETNITIAINVSTLAIAGESGDILVSVTDPQANLTKMSPIQVLVIEGGGPQTAEYDPIFGAPRCYAEGSSCSSGELLDGRGEVAPGEPNQPNTLDDCLDGSWGNYHAHPSVDKIDVRGKNGNVEMSENDAVIISATVWATMPDDLSADFYYTSAPDDPDWIYIDTLTTSKSGEAEVLEVVYNLPPGTNQAVRVNFRYLGSAGTCPEGNYWNYGDADDLIFTVKQASFSISCPEGIVRINKENTPETFDVECGLSISSDYNGTIDLSCSSSSLTGINCTTPPTVDISKGDTAVTFNLTLDADTSVIVGEEGNVLVSASDAIISKTSAISVSVVSPGGDQIAFYDQAYGAPFCDLIGKSCSSGDLLYGRGPVTPELNQPNTLDDCQDGAKGDHHSDESIDAIVIRSGRVDEASNNAIREGQYAVILAKVWAYSPLDSGDFFITTNPADPSWEYIGSVNATNEDAADELVLETILPIGLIQAVRVNFHYRTDEDIAPCLGGSWDDVDDLVFSVEAIEESPPSASPTTSTATQLPSSLSSTTTSPTMSSSPTDSKENTVVPTTSPVVSGTGKPTLSPTIGAVPTFSPVIGGTNPSASPSSTPSLAPTHASSASPSASPIKTPSSVILMSSSLDWNIACDQITDNETLIMTAQVFELSVMEILELYLNSNQELNFVRAAEICGVVVPDHNAFISVRRLQDTSPVYFSMEAEESCGGCDSNSTVAETLFDQVNNGLNMAVNNGELADTLHSNGNAANLTALGNATIISNSFKSNYTLITNSPTAAPSSKQPSLSPSTSPTSNKGTPQPSKQLSVSPAANSPSIYPSKSPTVLERTLQPSNQPSLSPNPSALPSITPTTNEDTQQPSVSPSTAPTQSPSTSPTSSPSIGPTAKEDTQAPTKSPSTQLSSSPSSSPTTNEETQQPSVSPSTAPTQSPSTSPTSSPSIGPTAKKDTQAPTQSPSTQLSSSPSSSPTSTTPIPTSPTTPQPSKSVGWYMKFSSMKCYQNCVGDPPCGGYKEFWNDAYPSLQECCIYNLGISDNTLTENCLEGEE